MILIADGGSTKCNWCQLDDAHNRVYFNTEGYNPDFIDTAGIVASLDAEPARNAAPRPGDATCISTARRVVARRKPR